MRKEGKSILEEIGGKRPFTVPEGYFENVTDSIMSALPEKPAVVIPKVTLWTKVKPFMYFAASFAGIYFCISGGLSLSKRISEDRAAKTAQSEETIYSDEYIDSFMETAMIDDYTLYLALTDSSIY